MNLLHPLTSLEWSKRNEIPVGVFNAQAVVLENKVYIGGGCMSPEPSSILLVYDFTKDLWDKLDTPTQWYALTSYNSQLVLVGGTDPNTGIATNQLWVLNEQCKWTQPLPPMTKERYQASAVNVGDHLIIAGGKGSSHVPLGEVEVYDGHQWRGAQSLLRPRTWMKSVLHEGKWYLDGGTQAEEDCSIYYTSLKSLIATTHSEGDEQSSVWKELPGSPLLWSTPAVFKNQLISVAGYPYSSAIHAYFPSNMSWVHVGDLPVACYSTCALVLSTGELMVTGGDSEYGLLPISFTATIGGNLSLSI